MLKPIPFRIVALTMMSLFALARPIAAPAGTETYSYDARGRLKTSCLALPSSGFKTNYTLDKADNRVNLTTQNQVFTISAGTGISSADGRFYLTMQTDGNFVLYGPSGVLWHTVTYGTAAVVAAFQSDGNLVLYTGSGGVIWASGTNSYCANLVLQNDGNLIIYSTSGAVVWQTGTGGH